MARIDLERRDGVALLRFDNPPKGYMNAEMVGHLEAAVDALLADEGVRVLVFTGALEGVFIEHYDVSELLALSTRMRAKGARFSADRPVPESPFHRTLAKLEAAPKPTIAAINGTAMGGGFEFCMAFEFVFEPILHGFDIVVGDFFNVFDGQCIVGRKLLHQTDEVLA